MRILVVDDDADLRDLLRRALEREGHLVRTAGTLAEARRAGDAQSDLLVLDLGLPDGSGLELCRALRDFGSAVPILVLTADSEVATRVELLDAGADDFLGKPFAVAELRARVRALGRRRGSAPPRATLVLDEVRLDIAARRAERGDASVALTAREWSILEALAARDGRVVARSTLLEETWGEATDSAASSLEVLIARIRRKLGPDVVRTVRGEGYALGGA